jgi:hypothetical protein
MVSAVGSLAREAAHCAEPQIDGAGWQMPRFQVNAISDDNGLAE